MVIFHSYVTLPEGTLFSNKASRIPAAHAGTFPVPGESPSHRRWRRRTRWSPHHHCGPEEKNLAQWLSPGTIQVYTYICKYIIIYSTLYLCIYIYIYIYYVYYFMYTILCILYHVYYIRYTVLCILDYVYYIMYTILCICMLPPKKDETNYYKHFNRNCQSIYLFGRDYGLLYTYMAWCKIMVIYFGCSKCLCLKMETWSPSCGIFKKENDDQRGYPRVPYFQRNPNGQAQCCSMNWRMYMHSANRCYIAITIYNLQSSLKLTGPVWLKNWSPLVPHPTDLPPGVVHHHRRSIQSPEARKGHWRWTPNSWDMIGAHDQQLGSFFAPTKKTKHHGEMQKVDEQPKKFLMISHKLHQLTSKPKFQPFFHFAGLGPVHPKKTTRPYSPLQWTP